VEDKISASENKIEIKERTEEILVKNSRAVKRK
jgi:hypothetical protein